MIRVFRCLLVLGGCALAHGARADNDESRSLVPGVALGFLYPQSDAEGGPVNGLAEAPLGMGEGAGVADVLAACRAGRRLWVYGTGSGRFRCRYVQDGNGGGVELLNYKGDFGAVTLATKPLVMQAVMRLRWSSREWATLREQAGRQAKILAARLLARKDVEPGELQSILGDRAHPAWRVEVGQARYFVVPVLQQHAEFDDFIVNLIFRRDARGLRYLGEVEGNLHGVVDLDGDGLPELLLDEHCDGNCQTYWKLEPTLKAVVQFTAGG